MGCQHAAAYVLMWLPWCGAKPCGALGCGVVCCEATDAAAGGGWGIIYCYACARSVHASDMACLCLCVMCVHASCMRALMARCAVCVLGFWRESAAAGCGSI